jgi:hypothetical protein
VPFLTLRNQTEADGLADMFEDQRSVLKGSKKTVATRHINGCFGPVVSIMLLERKGGEPTFAAMRTNGRYADDVAANSSSLVVSSSHHFD